MPLRHLTQTCGLLATLLLPALSAAQPAEDPLLMQSRAIVGEFAANLQSELQAAIADGGPLAAIDVCKTEAITIASELSRQHGVKLSRTSLQIRNPLNTPEPWQREALTAFETQAQSGAASSEPPEYFSRESDNTVRYMRAIPTGGLCLVCHGEAIADDVTDALAREYPHDAATGYQAGDIRGAFSIVWPAASSQ